jgi:glycine cleavage system protein P-like pyridoxal-binding family
MSILKTSSRWPLYLAIAGLVVVVIFSVVYTNYLARKLADNEAKYVELYRTAVERVSNTDMIVETDETGRQLDGTQADVGDEGDFAVRKSKK